MLPEPQPDLRAALDLGATLVVGEVEGRLERILGDAYHGRLKPIYNFMNDLPHLGGQPTPFLPEKHIRRYVCPLPETSAALAQHRGGARCA